VSAQAPSLWPFRKNSVLRNSTVSLIVRLIATLCSFLVIIGITRLLTPDDAGRYFLLYSFASVAAVVIGLGVNLTAVRLVSQAIALEAPGRARRAVRSSLSILAFSALCFSIVLALAPTQTVLRELLRVNIDGLLLVLLFSWTVALALQGLIGEVFRGMHDILRASIHGGLCSSLICLAGLAVMLLVARPSLDWVVALTASAALLAVAIAAASLYSRTRNSPLGDSEPTVRATLAMSLPFWGTNVALIAFSQADLWILNQLATSHSLALYGAATRLTQMLTMPLLVLNSALIPIISAQHALGKTQSLDRLLRNSAAIAAVPALIALLVFAAGGPWLLEFFFGESYRDANLPLLILATGQCVNVLCGSAGYTLLMTGQQKDVFWITFASGVSMSVLAWSLGSLYGATGVAVAAAVALAAQSLFMSWLVWWRLGLLTLASPGAMLHPLRTLRALA
jgi:O-antigen/teichoic acid export membrane protein